MLPTRLDPLEAGAAAEQRGAAAVGPQRAHQPTAPVREPARELALLDLSSDAIFKVFACADADAELAIALTCRKLRELRALYAQRPLKTSVASLLEASRPYVQWAVESCGAPLSVRLCVSAARRGDHEMLI